MLLCCMSECLMYRNLDKLHFSVDGRSICCWNPKSQGPYKDNGKQELVVAIIPNYS